MNKLYQAYMTGQEVKYVDETWAAVDNQPSLSPWCHTDEQRPKHDPFEFGYEIINTKDSGTLLERDGLAPQNWIGTPDKNGRWHPGTCKSRKNLSPKRVRKWRAKKHHK